MQAEVSIKGGFEIVAVVEDLVTLRSTAAVLVYVDAFVEGTAPQRLHEGIMMIEVPEYAAA